MTETRPHSSLRITQNEIIPPKHFESDLGLPVRPPGFRIPGGTHLGCTGDRPGLRRNVPGSLEARKGPAEPFKMPFGSYRIVPTDMKNMPSLDHFSTPM